MCGFASYDSAGGYYDQQDKMREKQRCEAKVRATQVYHARMNDFRNGLRSEPPRIDDCDKLW